MAITIDDFNKIWASTSPLTPYEFSESNYKEGWNFIGGTPPSRQMWDFLQKQNDEKLEYLLNNFDDYAKKTDLDDYAKKTDLNDYLPLAGGTMTGAIEGNPLTLTADDGNGNSADLVLNADGSATLDGNNVITSAGGTFTGTVNGVTPSVGDNSTKMSTTAYVQTEISAVNTRLGTILEASGTSTAQNSYSTICSISTHPAGTWLIVSFMDLNYSGDSPYNQEISPSVHSGVTIRNISTGGGGSTSVLLTVLDENEVVSLRGYQLSSGTMRGNLKMVQLA